MGRFTIFRNEQTIEGDHSCHPAAIALINCDDVYDDAIKETHGLDGLKKLKAAKNRQEFKHFIEINTII